MNPFARPFVFAARSAQAASLAFLLSAALADDFPAPVNTQPGAPMPAAAALASIKAPPGFHVSLFASEPEVQQPIAMATDARGRLWVAENYTYGEAKVGFDLRQRDRIIILEDADHDGRAEKRTVFTDQVQRLSSVEVGFGGVWVLAAPQLLFSRTKTANGEKSAAPQIHPAGEHFRGRIRSVTLRPLRLCASALKIPIPHLGSWNSECCARPTRPG